MQTGRLVAQYLHCDVLMYCDVLELVRAGDTRWTSNYRAVRAVRHCLRTIVITLQEIHSAAGDLSSEAGGLLLTFQNRKSVLLIFALEQVLQPLNALTLGLQSPKLSLAELPQKVDSAISRLQEIIADSSSYSDSFTEFETECQWSWVGEAVDIGRVHKEIVTPYVTAFIRNMNKRFGDAIGNVSLAASVFKPCNVLTASLSEQQEQVRQLASYFELDKDEAANEWSCFRHYLSKRVSATVSDVFKSLLNSDVGDSYPALSTLAGIIVACPVGTAGVERSFSTMNRLCTRLRQRLTPQHLNKLLMIVQEGPTELTRDELKQIAYLWLQQKPRRIQFPPPANCSA